jgi:hypothetical protein
MNRLAQLSIIVLLCVALTGCEEKTGSTVYHNGSGTVTAVDNSRNHFTGQNHVRTRRYGSEQDYQQAQNDDVVTRILMVGAAIASEAIFDQSNEESHHQPRATQGKTER